MWEVLIASRILTANVGMVIVLKKMLGETVDQREKKILLSWQFLFCLLFSFAALKISGREISFLFVNPLCLIVLGIGFLNSFGVYCMWRALDISVSKTSMGTQLDDIIALILGYLFLGEAKILNLRLSVGIVLCFLAAIILVGFKKRDPLNFRLIKFVLGYSVVWGVAAASYRFLNLQGLPIPDFLVSWYGGSLLGAVILLFFTEKKITGFRVISVVQASRIFVLSLFIWVSLALGYLVSALAPVAIYQPIFLISEAVVPTLIGLYLFRERKELRSKEWLAIFIGIAGALLVGSSY